MCCGFAFADNTLSILAKHSGFSRQKQEVYLLPIVVSDSGTPPMSSTGTLTIRVCGCSSDGTVQSCNAEAFVLPIGLSMGALIAILACIILLLGGCSGGMAALPRGGSQRRRDRPLTALAGLNASHSSERARSCSEVGTHTRDRMKSVEWEKSRQVNTVWSAPDGEWICYMF